MEEVNPPSPIVEQPQPQPAPSAPPVKSSWWLKVTIVGAVVLALLFIPLPYRVGSKEFVSCEMPIPRIPYNCPKPGSIALGPSIFERIRMKINESKSKNIENLNALPTPTPDLYTESSRSATANWKTYSNKKLGIEFRYPDDLKIATESASTVSFNGLFQPGNQVVSSFTISTEDIIDVKNLKLCSELTSTDDYCVENRDDIKKLKLAGVEIIKFPAFFGNNSGGQWASYHIIQTISDPIIEFKQPISGGSLTDLDRILPTIKFLPEATPTPGGPRVCAQVITPAKNPQTGECKQFPTPCDVSEGWVKVGSCP